MTLQLVGTRSSHNWKEWPGNFDKLNCRALFGSSNEWGIPDMPKADWIPAKLVAYNDRRAVAKAGDTAAIHFFLDDYRFETMWTKPQRGLSRCQGVGSALTPDFSLWRDMPWVMQLWQVYRSRWCGMWLEMHGVRTIPTVSWSTGPSFDFCFAGIAQGSVVAISTVGARDKESWPLFVNGLGYMVATVEPSLILVYGAPMDLPDFGTPYKFYGTRWGEK